MPFDPDQYLASKGTSQGFDPDQYLATKGLSTNKSSYSGVDDKDLNVFQKGERKLGDWGLIQPGQELFSPGAIENKKMLAGPIAGAGMLAATAINPTTAPIALKLGKEGLSIAAKYGIGFGLLRKATKVFGE